MPHKSHKLLQIDVLEVRFQKYPRSPGFRKAQNDFTTNYPSSLASDWLQLDLGHVIVRCSDHVIQLIT